MPAHCGEQIAVPPAALSAERLDHCLVCPSADLFVRKDFPQRLGVAIVDAGHRREAAWPGLTIKRISRSSSCFSRRLIDVALYLVVPNALMCYRCGAMYRGAPGLDSHSSFDLETHERHRQQKARLAEHRRG